MDRTVHLEDATTFSITTLSILILKLDSLYHKCYAGCNNLASMRDVIMLKVVMVSIAAKSAVMLSSLTFSVVMLSVVNLSVIGLSVVVPSGNVRKRLAPIVWRPPHPYPSK